MPEQIYYSNWSDKLEGGHENYWRDISDISIMIGNDLIGPYQMNYIRKDDEDYLRQLHSIAVLQTKEKFGEVRVYCSIGCEYIISKKYSNHVSDVNKKNKEWQDFMRSGAKPAGYSKWWEKKMREEYPIQPLNKEKFYEDHINSDIMHYRNTYLKYIRLFPHYKDAILGGASFSEYLFETKEDAIKYIKEMEDEFLESKEKFEWDEDMCSMRINIIKNTKDTLFKIHNLE